MKNFWDFEGMDHTAPALILPGQAAVSYGALSKSADDWRGWLEALAGGNRPLVGLEFSTTSDHVAAYIGALRAGLPVVLAEPGQLSGQSDLFRHWRPGIRLSDGAVPEATCDPAGTGFASAPHPDLRLLLSTSGSTGDPKLVRLSGRNIAANATSIAEYLAIAPDDRAMLALPLFYSYGLSVLNSYLAAGAALILSDHSVVDAPFWTIARAERATSLALVPHQFDLLDKSGFDGRDLPDLRYVTQAGGRLAPDVARRFHAMGRRAGWDLVMMYGQTEAAPRIAYVPPAALPGAADTIGRAIPGGRLWIADAHGGEITAPGCAGELIYEGPNVMMGYARTPADLARPAEVRALRTGDLAERTAQGFFRITGRLKRFVKLYGYRISLDRIEALLQDRGIQAQAVAVQDRLVLLHHDVGTGEMACRIVAAQYGLPLAALTAAPLARLPVLASGKPDHGALRELARAALSKPAPDRRRSPHSARPAPPLDAVLAQATRSAEVRAEDSFAALGGDSLSYLQMQMALEDRLGRVPEGWEEMSLAQLNALKPAAGQDADGSAAAALSRPTSRVGGDVLLRILALTLVVAQHASNLPLYGGTWMLILLMGYSVGRFQLRQIATGQGGAMAFKMLYAILPLYFLILLAYGTLRDPVEPLMIALLGNYRMPTEGSFLGYLWFVSLYAQLVLVLVIFAALPRLRRFLAARTWRTVAALLNGALALQAGLALAYPPYLADSGGFAALAGTEFPVPHMPMRGLVECLPIFLLGWAIQAADSHRQRRLTVLAVLTVLALFADTGVATGPVVWLGLTALVLARGMALRVPAALAHGLQRLAGASLFIYLTHMLVVHAIRYQSDFHDLHGDLPTALICVLLAFPLGLLCQWLFERCDRAALSLRRRRRLATREG